MLICLSLFVCGDQSSGERSVLEAIAGSINKKRQRIDNLNEIQTFLRTVQELSFLIFSTLLDLLVLPTRTFP